MKNTYTRGLCAVLLVLAAALPARALIIDHTFSATPAWTVQSGWKSQWGATLALPGFNPALGTLNSVSLAATLAGTATVYEMNPYGTPTALTPSFSLNLTTGWFGAAGTGSPAPTVVVPGSGLASFTTPFAVELSATTAAAGALNHFTTAGNLGQYFAADTHIMSFGWISFPASALNGTLSYDYTPLARVAAAVAEGLPSATGFAAALGLLGWLAHRDQRRRRVRSLPGV